MTGENIKSEFNRDIYCYFDKNGNATGINFRLFSNSLIEKYHFKTIRDSHQLLYYKDGFYHYDEGYSIIEEECENTFPDIINKRSVSEILGHVQRSTFIDRKEVNNNPWLLNLENGLFNIETGGFIEHTFQYVITIRLPINYNPKSECPEIKKFISEIVKKEDIQKLYELGGYTLYRGYPIHSFFIFLGSGNNGKTTFMNLLNTLVGSDNISHTALQNLMGFLIQGLFGKMINSVGDLNSTEIRKVGNLKQLTGEDEIEAPIKFNNKTIKFKNYAKLIYSCNELPPTTEKSDAFYERSEVIIFPKKFNDNKDIMLLKKLTTTDELSGFFNIIIESLKKILKKGEFSNQLPLVEKRHLYEKASNPIYRFVNEYCERNKESYVHKQRLRRVYIDFCENNNVPIEEEKKFKNILMKTFTYIGEAQRGGIGNSKPSWTGINLIGDECKEE